MVSMTKDTEEYKRTLKKIKDKVLSEVWTVKKFKDFMIRNFQENGIGPEFFRQYGDDSQTLNKVHVLSMVIQTLDMTKNPEEHMGRRKTSRRMKKLLEYIDQG